MSLLEAMAARIPSVYTVGCNLPELAMAGGGWEITGDLCVLIECLRSTLTRRSSLRAFGQRACDFGSREYTLESVADRLLQMYAEAAGISAPVDRNIEGA